MPQRVKSHILIGLLLAVACILLLAYFSYDQINDSDKQSAKIKNKQDQLNIAYRILIDMQSMETGQRGYVLTKDPQFLTSYQQGLVNLSTDTIQLLKTKSLSSYNSQFVYDLMNLVRLKLSHMQKVVQLQHKTDSDAAKNKIGKKEGLGLMNEIRLIIDDFESHQHDQLNSMSAGISQLSARHHIRLAAIVLAFILIIIISFYIINLDYKKNAAQNKLLAYHSALIQNISDAIVSTDNQFNISDWNKNAEVILGQTKKEVIGKNIFQLLKIDTDKEQLHDILSHLSQNIPWRGDLSNYQKADKAIFLEMASSIIFNKQGDKIGTVNVFRDITQQKENQQRLQLITRKLEIDVTSKMGELTRTNEELMATRERFYLISNATNEAIWDWEIASNKIWGNQAYLKLLDKNEGEHIDYNEFVQRVTDEDNKKIAELFKCAIIKQDRNFITQFQFRHSDGSLRQFVNRSFIIYDNDGKPIRCLGGLTDVTSEYQIQQQILKEKELSESLINSLPGVFYIFNKEGKYLRWNKNILAISGYSEEELKNMRPLDFVPEENKASLLEKIQSVFVHGSDTVESVFLTKDGTKIPYYFTGSHVKINGEDCLMGVGYDMTEKMMYQQQLKDLANHLQNIREEEQSRISREIHDELGQQLTGMKLQLTMLKKQYDKGENNIVEKINELIQLTDQTLKSTRRISIQLRPSILDDLGLIPAMEWLLDDVKKKYNYSLIFKTHVQDIDISPVLSSAIYRIFQESITNIIRHANATIVNISLDINDELISLSITDNGKGFDTKKLPLGKTLGILGMKERADMIGAFFDVYSALGEGTRIIIRKKLDNEKSQHEL